MATYDAILLGSSVNELVCAAYLAKAGKKVLVLESRASLGGPAALEPVADGFRAAVAPAEDGWISEKVVRDLDLEAHGFRRSGTDAPLVGLGGEAPVLLSADLAATRASIAKHSPKDAEKWPAFAAQMDRLAGFLETLYAAPAVDLMNPAPTELVSLAGHGLRLRRLGKVDMVELLRVLPMSISDLLDDWFESDALKATLATTGVRNLFQGPKSAGTGYTFLHHLVGRAEGAFGSRAFPSGEAAHLLGALTGALKRLGVDVQTNVTATVNVHGSRAVGATLTHGEALEARAVISGADPKRAFLQQVAPWHLPPEFVRRVTHVKLRGIRSTLLLAVDRLPAFRGLGEAELRGTLVTTPTLQSLERAFDAAKHGGLPESPSLEVTIPSLHDPSLAPAGKHVVHVAIQFTPYPLRSQPWDDAAREAVTGRALATLERHAPGIGASVVGRRLVTPVDLESTYGLTEGNLYGGELTLDQILFMRPVAGYARHAGPIPGHFVCGDATHPGGAIPGLAGHHAAEVALRSL